MSVLLFHLGACRKLITVIGIEYGSAIISSNWAAEMHAMALIYKFIEHGIYAASFHHAEFIIDDNPTTTPSPATQTVLHLLNQYNQPSWS